jgi:hypothetical protein
MGDDDLAAATPPTPFGGAFVESADLSCSMRQLRASALEKSSSPALLHQSANGSSTLQPANRTAPKRAPGDLRSSGHAIRNDWELEWRLESLPRQEDYDLLLDPVDGKVCAV